MRDFNDRRNRRSDDRFRRRDDDRGGSYNRSGSGSMQMYPATCDECGKSCEVPFRPTGDRPVYCSDCFERMGGGNRRDRRDDYRDTRRDGYRDNRSSGFGRKQMFSAICDKCGKECEVPFRPTGDRPVYCSDCFEKNEGGRGDFPRSSGESGDTKAVLDEINSKLDKIMKDLGTTRFVRVPKDEYREEKQAEKGQKSDEKNKKGKTNPDSEPIAEKIEKPSTMSKEKTKSKKRVKKKKSEGKQKKNEIDLIA